MSKYCVVSSHHTGLTRSINTHNSYTHDNVTCYIAEVMEDARLMNTGFTRLIHQADVALACIPISSCAKQLLSGDHMWPEEQPLLLFNTRLTRSVNTPHKKNNYKQKLHPDGRGP